MDNTTESNNLIYARSKIVNDIIEFPQGAQTKTPKLDGKMRQERQKNYQNKRKQQRKKYSRTQRIEKSDNSNTDKTDNTNGRNKPKNTGEKRKTRKIPEQNQAIQGKQALPN